MKARVRRFSIICGIILIGGILFCQFIYDKKDGVGKRTVSAREMKEQFFYEEGSMLPVYNLDQQQPLIFDLALDYDYVENDRVDYRKFITVHTDASCSKESEVECHVWTQKRRGKTRLVLTPYEPVLPNDTLRYESDDFAFDKYTIAGVEYSCLWGCAPIYYICIRCDVDDPEAALLNRPKVIPFTVASESEVPDVEGIVDDTGGLTLRWKPVEGAEYYTVYHYYSRDTWSGESNETDRGAESGYRDGVFWSIGKTKETEFSEFDGIKGVEWLEEAEKDEEETGKDEENGQDAGKKENLVFLGEPLSNLWSQNAGIFGSFFVTATVDGKESNLSASIDTADLKIPYKFEDNPNYEGYEGVDALPDRLPIINIDGSVMQRPVYYRLRSRGYMMSMYDFQVKGTLLGGIVLLFEEDGNLLPTVISKSGGGVYLDTNTQLNKVPSMAVKSILEREELPEDAKNLYGLVREQTVSSVKEGDEERIKAPDENIRVFADSAGEAWIAYGLLAGEEEISLKAFPDLQNPYILEDVFLKVCHQNPYILGVSSYYYDYDGISLKISYCYSKKEIAEKQQQIYRRGQEIVEGIIKESMTDEEKERQIYLWLESNCRYALREWEQAKEQDFIKEGDDAGQEDSLNAYGALVKGEAMCQGYAGAFQILGDMAGLEVQTVNGYLNGNIPHAWNLVKLGEAWYQTDCSSNGNTGGIPFYLYNSDLEHARLLGYYLLEDFLLDGEMELLEEKNQDDSREYYKANGFVAGNMDEIEEIIERQTEEAFISFYYKGTEFDEERFIQIVRRVFLKKGMEDILEHMRYKEINGYIVIYP